MPPVRMLFAAASAPTGSAFRRDGQGNGNARLDDALAGVLEQVAQTGARAADALNTEGERLRRVLRARSSRLVSHRAGAHTPRGVSDAIPGSRLAAPYGLRSEETGTWTNISRRATPLRGRLIAETYLTRAWSANTPH
jgi:hypothetical protein